MRRARRGVAARVRGDPMGRRRRPPRRRPDPRPRQPRRPADRHRQAVARRRARRVRDRPELRLLSLASAGGAGLERRHRRRGRRSHRDVRAPPRRCWHAEAIALAAVAAHGRATSAGCCSPSAPARSPDRPTSRCCGSCAARSTCRSPRSTAMPWSPPHHRHAAVRARAGISERDRDATSGDDADADGSRRRRRGRRSMPGGFRRSARARQAGTRALAGGRSVGVRGQASQPGRLGLDQRPRPVHGRRRSRGRVQLAGRPRRGPRRHGAVARYDGRHSDARHSAITACAIVCTRVLEHDETAARQAFDAHLDAHPIDDRLGTLHLRRHLAVGYVLVPELRQHWDAAPLGPHHVRVREAARRLLDARRGELDSGVTLPDPGLVITALPQPWSVELAVAACRSGAPDGRALLSALTECSLGATRSSSRGSARMPSAART